LEYLDHGITLSASPEYSHRIDNQWISFPLHGHLTAVYWQFLFFCLGQEMKRRGDIIIRSVSQSFSSLFDPNFDSLRPPSLLPLIVVISHSTLNHLNHGSLLQHLFHPIHLQLRGSSMYCDGTMPGIRCRRLTRICRMVCRSSWKLRLNQSSRGRSVGYGL
jgi:hypothetical protein